MKKFVLDINAWINEISSQSYNINKQYINTISDIDNQYNIIHNQSELDVLYSWTYDEESFIIFYNLTEPDIYKRLDKRLTKRLNLYNPSNLNFYMINPDATCNIGIDTTCNINDIIPNSKSISEHNDILSENIYKLTYLEYYFIDILKQYKNGIIPDISDIDNIPISSNLAKIIKSILKCELLDIYELPDLSTDNIRLIDQVFEQWFINYMYLKKQLCYSYLNETFFESPSSKSQIFILNEENIFNNYLEMDFNTHPIDITRINLFHKNKLIDKSKYDYFVDSTAHISQITWNNKALKSDLSIGDKLYIMWAYLPIDELDELMEV